MEKFKKNNRPDSDSVNDDDNNANQEKEYRKDKRDGKIDDSEE